MLSSAVNRRLAALEPERLQGDAVFLRYADNPVGFARDILGVPVEGLDPWPGARSPYLWQHNQDILNAIAQYQRVSVASCHSIGKDWTAARAVVWFVRCHTNAIAITSAPTGRQVKQLLWGEVKLAVNRSKTPIGPPPNMLSWELAPDRYAIGFKSKDEDPERFQGYHAQHILYVIDEASGVDDIIFDAIEGGMASGDARILLISNPLRAGGKFWSTFHVERKYWHTIQIGAADTPNFVRQEDPHQLVPHPDGMRAFYLIQPEWALEKIEQRGLDSAFTQAKVFGEFPSEGIDTLIPLYLVDRAQNLEADDERNVKLPFQIGVDCARFGDDESVAFVRQGRRFVTMRHWQKRDTMYSAHAVANLIVEIGMTWGRVLVDEIGIGSGVLDRLKEMQEAGEIDHNIEFIGVNVGEKPTDAREGAPSMRYKLLRDELWDSLADKFKFDMVRELPEDDMLTGQLSSVRYAHDTVGRLVVEPKDEMKKRGLDSPDRADACALAYWEMGMGAVRADEGTLKELDLGHEFDYARGLWDKVL